VQSSKQPVLWRIFLALVSLESAARPESPASVSSRGILEETCTKGVETNVGVIGGDAHLKFRGGDAHLKFSFVNVAWRRMG
jgi:hypothetical protein